MSTKSSILAALSSLPPSQELRKTIDFVKSLPSSPPPSTSIPSPPPTTAAAATTATTTTTTTTTFSPNTLTSPLYTYLSLYPTPHPTGSLCTTPTQILTLFLHAYLTIGLKWKPVVEYGSTVKGFERKQRVVDDVSKEKDLTWCNGEDGVGWIVKGKKVKGIIKGDEGDGQGRVSIIISGSVVFSCSVSSHVNVLAMTKGLSRSSDGVSVPMYMVDCKGLTDGVKMGIACEGMVEIDNYEGEKIRRSPDAEWEDVTEDEGGVREAEDIVCDEADGNGRIYGLGEGGWGEGGGGLSNPRNGMKDYFDQDLRPSSIGGIGGITGGGIRGGGNLVGPDAPVFNDHGNNESDPLRIGAPRGGFGYLGDTGMGPRFDPIYPEGIGGQQGRGRGRGRGRGGNRGPNNDMLKPPGWGDSNMFM